MNTKIGFTGTRNELTIPQRDSLQTLLEKLQPDTFHQGACVGADEEATALASKMESPPHIVGHPCTLTNLVSQKACLLSDELKMPQAPLVRNAAIVDASDILIACPEGSETRRSGTWSTVRLARRLEMKVYIVWPDGRVEEA